MLCEVAYSDILINYLLASISVDIQRYIGA